MIFNKTFLVASISLSLLVITLPGTEIPNLVSLCGKAFAQGAKGCENMPEYFKQLDSLTDEVAFTTFITAQSNDGYTVLHHAASTDLISVQTLLNIYQKKAKEFNDKRQNIDAPYPSLQEFINIQNNNAITPLDRTIKYRKFDIADTLIQKGASLITLRIIPDQEDKNALWLSPLLTTAILSRNVKGIDYLLKQGVCIGDSNLIKAKYVPNTEAQNFQQNGWMLVQPEEYNLPYKEDMLIFLRPHQINPLSLFIEDSFAPHNHITQLLINHAGTPQERAALIHQGLQSSVQFGNFHTLKAIVSMEPHILNHYPYILIDVMQRGHDDTTDILTLLIDAGATVNIIDGNGNTPLHHAVTSQPLAIVRRLIGRGANINAINHGGDTPLNILPKFRDRTPERTNIRRYLIKKGALTGRKARQVGLRE